MTWVRRVELERGGVIESMSSLARGESSPRSQWVLICMSVPFMCVCMLSHYPSFE